MCVIFEYLKIKESDIDEDIIMKYGYHYEELEDLAIREIKIRNKWKKIKDGLTNNIKEKVKELIELNTNKNPKEIDISIIEELIKCLRQEIAKSSKDLIKEIEI